MAAELLWRDVSAQRNCSLNANPSSTNPLDLLLYDFMKSSAGLHNGRKGDPLPLADLGGSQHFPSESRFRYCNYPYLRNITPLQQSSHS